MGNSASTKGYRITEECNAVWEMLYSFGLKGDSAGGGGCFEGVFDYFKILG